MKTKERDLSRLAPNTQQVTPAPRYKRPTRLAEILKQSAVNGSLSLLAALFVLPLYWLAITSFLPREQILSAQQTLLLTHPTVQNYQELLTTTSFLQSMLNSVIVSAAITLVGMYISALAGYAFAKHHFPGRNVLFTLILSTMMIPVTVTVIPNFILLANIGLIGTLWAVILPQLALPFGIFWMRQYIQAAVPNSLLEAARIDGAGVYATFWRVVYPIITPGLAGLAIWLFLNSWNALLLPLVYLQSNSLATYPVFLASLMGFHAAVPTNLLVAACVLATVPMVLIFIVAQKRFVAAITAGAVKE